MSTGLRAERRLGELIRAQKETVGLAQGKRTDLVPSEHQVDKPTLADAGIDKSLANRARKFADRRRKESPKNKNMGNGSSPALTGSVLAEMINRWQKTTRNSGDAIMPFEFVHLSKALGTWDEFVRDWESQCRELGEDFSCYEVEPIGVVKDLAEGPHQDDAAAYALHDGDRYAAMCQVNRTLLPGYTGQVLRVRMLYLSPYYEFGEFSLDQYSRLIIDVFYRIIEISNNAMRSQHIKFHLRSPADRQFFASFGNALDGAGVFESVTTRGAWLYITKN